MFKSIGSFILLSIVVMVCMVASASATNPPNIQNVSYCIVGSVTTLGANPLHAQYDCQIKALSEADCKTEIKGILTTIIAQTNYEGTKTAVILAPYKTDGTNAWNFVPADIKHNLSCAKTVN